MNLLDKFNLLVNGARRQDREDVPRENPVEQLKQYITDSLPYNYLRLQGNEDSPAFNPKWSFGTPVGISAYPLTTARYEIALKNEHEFANAYPVIYIFQAKNSDKILYTNNYNENDLENDLKKLRFKFTNKRYVETDVFLPKISEVDFYKTRALTQALVKIPAGYLFFITRELAEQDPVKWTKILMSLGYQGVHSSADGVLHVNEPEQACFFGSSTITVLDKLNNQKIRMHGLKDNYEKFGLSPKETKLIYKINEAVNSGKPLTDEEINNIIDIFYYNINNYELLDIGIRYLAHCAYPLSDEYLKKLLIVVGEFKNDSPDTYSMLNTIKENNKIPDNLKYLFPKSMQ